MYHDINTSSKVSLLCSAETGKTTQTRKRNKLMEWLIWLGAAWFTMGVYSLYVYLRTWTDKPPLWFWPIIIVFWPAVWTGGIIHPLR